MEDREKIRTGQTALGIEFGSTNIKAVLSDLDGKVLSKGSHRWENHLTDGIWTYPYEEIEAGLQDCYRSLAGNVDREYGEALTTVGAIGISAMMHGMIALGKDGKPLSPFQTWRNSNTQEAADKLTSLFSFNIPLRWTIAHLYQCVLEGEDFLKDLAFVTTLDSYIHFRLTGEKVTGIGDASGIFPIDSDKLDYDQGMVDKFDDLIASSSYPWKTRDVLPKVLVAGDKAGALTEEGARFLDPTGTLEAGIPLCPPEGDAGTGMTATNAVAPRTGNVSAGTSTFAMVVTEKPLSKVHREIDMVTTPDGKPCAMSHANNGTTDINAWVDIFREFAEISGADLTGKNIYSLLYEKSLEGDPDCGGLVNYGYYSGEGVTKLNEGRPLYVRMPGSRLDLANFIRAELYSSLAAVKMGMDILEKDEHVRIDRITGHGGLFTTPGCVQKYLAAAIHTPVTVLPTATEGGPWGMALLAAYMLEGGRKKESLPAFLDRKIFSDMGGVTLDPDPETEEGYETFMDHYRKGLSVESAAVDNIRW